MIFFIIQLNNSVLVIKKQKMSKALNKTKNFSFSFYAIEICQIDLKTLCTRRPNYENARHDCQIKVWKSASN